MVSNSVDHNAIQDGGTLLLKLLKLRHLEKSSDFRLKGVRYFKVTQPGLVSNFCGGIVLKVDHIGIISKLLVYGLPVDHCGDPAGRRLLQRGQHLPLSHHQDGIGARRTQPAKIVRNPKKQNNPHIGNYVTDV